MGSGRDAGVVIQELSDDRDCRREIAHEPAVFEEVLGCPEHLDFRAHAEPEIWCRRSYQAAEKADAVLVVTVAFFKQPVGVAIAQGLPGKFDPIAQLEAVLDGPRVVDLGEHRHIGVGHEEGDESIELAADEKLGAANTHRFAVKLQVREQVRGGEHLMVSLSGSA